MAETKFEQMSQGGLVRTCEAKGLDHTGDREALIAKLVAYEEAKDTESETEPEPAVEPSEPAEPPEE